MSRARPKPIIPWWQLGLLLFACAVGIWFLLPDDPGLVEDLIRDGKAKDARRVLAKISPAAREREAHRLRVIELRLARLELKAGDTANFNRFWLQAIGAWRASQFSAEVFLEFVPVVSHLPDPAAAWRQIRPAVPQAPEVQRKRLAAEFIRAALAANQPAAAARIFADINPAGQRTPEQSLELARLWQLGGNPAEALAALGESTTPKILTRRIELLRALNRNREALALLIQQAATAPGGIPDDALADELAAVGLAAGLPGEAAGPLRAHAEQHPADLAAQRRLRDLLVSSGQAAEALAPALRAVQAGARAPADLRALAQILEYAGRGADAFDLWLELALQGDLPAVDRLVALNPGVYRDEDLRRALEQVVPVPNHADYTLKLAQLEVGVGRYSDGQRYYEKYLAAVPEDVDAIIELADLHRELYRFADAERWLRRAATLRPREVSLRRQIADNLVLQNRHTDALNYYAKLAPESPTPEVLQPYTVLAESLGRYDHLIRAFRLRIDHSPVPAARDYLLLAYAYELSDDLAGREAALAEGRQRLAQDDDLKLQLALAQSATKNYRAAQADLASHTGLHANPAAATLYLELMRLNNDQAAERAYLAQPLAPALTQDETILERIGRAREALGEFAEAERIWRRLYEIRPDDFNRVASLARVLMTTNRPVEAGRLLAPFLRRPTPGVLRLSAEIATIAGDYQNAEAYQLAFLAQTEDAGPTDWGALGDIRLSRGDRDGAKRAYAEALRRLHGQIRRQAAKS